MLIRGSRRVWRTNTPKIGAGVTSAEIYQTPPAPTPPPSYPDVADANERLSMDPDTPIGTIVHQVDNDTNYQLAAPSSAQGGVFVTGSDQDGLYSKRGTALGKDYYNLLGEADDATHSAISWDGVSDWVLYNALGSPRDNATGNVATPDLATWAVSTVTSVTEGELAAGLRIGSDTYQVNASVAGRKKYVDVLALSPEVTWDADHSRWDKSGTINFGNVAFPWQGTPEVSVTQDNVASESNWTTI